MRPTLERLGVIVALLAVCVSAPVVTAQATCRDWGTAGLAGGVNGEVFSMRTVPAGVVGAAPAIVVTGGFTTAGGIASRGVAAWDGSQWIPLPGILDIAASAEASVRLAEVYNDGAGPRLYVAGSFRLAGVTDVVSLASWNGSTWTVVGGGLASDPRIWTMHAHDDGQSSKLYIGGSFTSIGPVGGTQPTQFIAAWNGAGWTTFPDGPNGGVSGLATHDFGAGRRLVVSGTFGQVGGVPSGAVVARGQQGWEILSTQYQSSNGQWISVKSIVAPGVGGLYAFGENNSLARWNGTQWDYLSGWTRDIAAFDDGFGTALFRLPAAGENSFDRFDGSAWTPVNAAEISPVRTDAAMVFDDARNRSVLFGGAMDPLQPGTELADTWEFDGFGWHKRNIPGPSARSQHGMAYDTLRDRVLLVGGKHSASTFSDVWSFNGTSWQALAPFPGPSRHSFAMCYDEARDRVVLFGGRSGAGALLDDTWEFDGSSWMQISTSPHPTPRYRVAIGYDPKRHVCVMWGGVRDVGGSSGELWEYNGSWTLLSPPTRDHPGDGESRSAFYHDVLECVVFAGDQWHAESPPTGWTGEAWRRFGGMNYKGTAATYHTPLQMSVSFGGDHTPSGILPNTVLRPATYEAGDATRIGEIAVGAKHLAVFNVGGQSRLFAAGQFSKIGRGKKLAGCIAYWGTPCAGPSILAQTTTSQPVFAGLPVVLSVEHAGVGPLSFQWRLNGQPVFVASSVFSNTQTGSMTVHGWNLDRDGPYDCVVTSPIGQVVSQPVSITIPRVPVNGPMDVVSVVTGTSSPQIFGGFTELLYLAAGPTSNGGVVYRAISRRAPDVQLVAFIARTRATDGSLGPARIVYQAGSAAPGMGAGAVFSGSGAFAMGPSGLMASNCGITSGATSTDALFVGMNSDDWAPLLRKGQPLVGFGLPAGTTIASFASPVFDAQDRLVFLMTLNLPASGTTIGAWEWSAATGLRPIHLEMPPSTSGIAQCTVADSGHVLLRVTRTGTTPTLLLSFAGTTTTILSPANPPPQIPANYVVSQVEGMLAPGGDVYATVSVTRTGQPSRSLIYRYSQGQFTPLFDDGRVWGAPVTEPSYRPLYVKGANARGDVVLSGMVPTCGLSCLRTAILLRTAEGEVVPVVVTDVTVPPAPMPATSRLQTGSNFMIGPSGEIAFDVNEVTQGDGIREGVLAYSRHAGLFPVSTNTTPFRLDSGEHKTVLTSPLASTSGTLRLANGVEQIPLTITGNDASVTLAHATLTEALEGSRNCPAFISPPLYSDTRLGHAMVARAAAGGRGPISYQWHFEGAPLADSPRVSGSQTAILTIAPLVLEDSGFYHVVATNFCGQTTGPTSQLIVPCPADLDDGSNTGTPDRAVNINDLLYFLVAFQQGSPAADLDDGTGSARPDQAVTIDDLLYFLIRLEAGC
jgi:Galactose oxidase, central domain